MYIMRMAISPHSPCWKIDVIGDPAIYPDAATLENLFTTRRPIRQKIQRQVDTDVDQN